MNNNKFLLNSAREAFTFFWYHSYLYGDMISSYPLLTWYVTMYANLASSFTYISVLVQFTFIFHLQLICASIYALLFGLGTVAQLRLWLLYTRITLPTLLNKIKELTHVGTYNCVVCTPANPSSKNKYVYAKHFNFVWIYTRIYVQEAPCQTLHHDSNGSTIPYCTWHTYTKGLVWSLSLVHSLFGWLLCFSHSSNNSAGDGKMVQHLLLVH